MNNTTIHRLIEVYGNEIKAVWLSFDVESTGPVAGLHSMLSIGVVPSLEFEYPEERPRFYIGSEEDSFSMNIEELPDAGWDEDTATWWNHEDRAAALTETLFNPQPPREVMLRLIEYLEGLLPNKQVWAAYPATFDMPFLRYYMNRFARDEWFGLYADDPMHRVSCFDIASAAMFMIGSTYHGVSKKKIVETLRPPRLSHRDVADVAHVAVIDARDQLELLIGVLESERYEQVP